MFRNTLALSPTSTTALALVGNPGTGKSTILNGIAGKSLFKSGIAIGEGLTTALKVEEQDGITLIDTPGLNTETQKGVAGRAIDMLLARYTPLKIAFVITLETGRVKPTDVLTIKVVLDSIEGVDTNDRFGVIVNHVKPGVMSKLRSCPEEEAVLRTQVTGERWTSHWCLVEFDRGLEDKSDGTVKLTGELAAFLYGLPETRPVEATVESINRSGLAQDIILAEKHISETASVGQMQREAFIAQLSFQLGQSKEREAHLVAELEKRNGEIVPRGVPGAVRRRQKMSNREKLDLFFRGASMVAVCNGCAIQ